MISPKRMMLCLGIVAACPFSEAIAQVPIGGPGPLPTSRPAFSPYLNLLRQGNSPTLNYFGIVRPEVNFMNASNQFQQQIADNQSSISQLQTGALPTMGHAATFLNTGGYFQSMRFGLGGTAGQGPPGGR